MPNLITASDDAKGSFSSELDTLKGRIAENVGADVIHVNAARILRDIERYAPWDSSWAPVNLGGYYSFNDIKSQLTDIIRRFPRALAQEASQRTSGPAASPNALTNAINAPIAQTIAAPDTCEQKALDTFGPILGRSAVAKTWTCHKWAVIAGSAALVIVPIAVYGMAIGFGSGISRSMFAGSGASRKKNKKK